MTWHSVRITEFELFTTQLVTLLDGILSSKEVFPLPDGILKSTSGGIVIHIQSGSFNNFEELEIFFIIADHH